MRDIPLSAILYLSLTLGTSSLLSLVVGENPQYTGEYKCGYSSDQVFDCNDEKSFTCCLGNLAIDDCTVGDNLQREYWCVALEPQVLDPICPPKPNPEITQKNEQCFRNENCNSVSLVCHLDIDTSFKTIDTPSIVDCPANIANISNRNPIDSTPYNLAISTDQCAVESTMKLAGCHIKRPNITEEEETIFIKYPQEGDDENVIFAYNTFCKSIVESGDVDPEVAYHINMFTPTTPCTDNSSWVSTPFCKASCGESVEIDRFQCTVGGEDTDPKFCNPSTKDDVETTRSCTSYEECVWELEVPCLDQCRVRESYDEKIITISPTDPVSDLPIVCLDNKGENISSICDESLERPSSMTCTEVSTTICATLEYIQTPICQAHHCGNDGFVSAHECYVESRYLDDSNDDLGGTAFDSRIADKVEDKESCDEVSKSENVGDSCIPHEDDIKFCNKYTQCILDEENENTLNNESNTTYSCDCNTKNTSFYGPYCKENSKNTKIVITDVENSAEVTNVQLGNSVMLSCVTSPENQSLNVQYYYTTSVSEEEVYIGTETTTNNLEFKVNSDWPVGEYTIISKFIPTFVSTVNAHANINSIGVGNEVEDEDDIGDDIEEYTQLISQKINVQGNCANLHCHEEGGKCNEVTNTCDCNTGFSGPRCTENICGCHHGICDSKTLQCDCSKTEYMGNKCQHAIECVEKVSCDPTTSSAIPNDDTGICYCECNQFWGGEICDQCKLECSNNGISNKECNKCVKCDPGYGFTYCNCRRSSIHFVLQSTTPLSTNSDVSFVNLVSNSIRQILLSQDTNMEVITEVNYTQVTIDSHHFINVRVNVFGECDKVDVDVDEDGDGDGDVVTNVTSITKYIINNINDIKSPLHKTSLFTTYKYVPSYGIGAEDGKCNSAISTCYPGAEVDKGEAPVNSDDEDGEGSSSSSIRIILDTVVVIASVGILLSLSLY